jgi:septal ring factor EnvC (AmiA/AmiB activator)
MSRKNYDEEDLKRVAGFITEHMESKFGILLENVDTLLNKRLTPIKQDIAELKMDMRVVKAAVTDTNKQVQSHERRISSLEAAV